jgi:hypothetical protein
VNKTQTHKSINRRTAQNRNMRRRRHGNTTPQNTNNSIDLVENVGNDYPVGDHSRMR